MSESVSLENREHWSSRSAFVFAAIGSAIGLGNVWRFPRICAENGGVAFLVAFVIALFTAGIPVLIMELAMGERTQKATPGAFKKVDREYEWFGWCIVGVGFFITCYYAVIMSWCCNYVVFSFTEAWGETPQDFFFRDFLGIASEALSDPSKTLPQTFGEILKGWTGFSWPILAGAAFTWIAIIACLWKGVNTVSKIVHATVLVPWCILLIFVVRGVTLEGADAGLSYYLIPKEGAFFEYLSKPGTWIAAYTQVFFSLSVGFGIMFAYGSFLKKETDIVKNAFIIAAADSMTAIVAGLAVFGCLGFLSTEAGGGTSIESWMGGSLGIAFTAYPTLISNTPLGYILGPLFFLMLLFLGIDSAFSLVEGVIKAFEDKFGWSHRKSMLTVCFAGFVSGLPFMFSNGLFWFDTLDHFMNHFGLVGACLVECLVFGHVYHSARIRRELLEHRDNHLGRWFCWTIRYVAPAVLSFMLYWEISDRVAGSYEGYGRVMEFCGGWLALILIGAVALAFTLMKGREKA